VPFQQLATIVLGTPAPDHPGIEPGTVPPAVTIRTGRLVPWLGGVLARMQGPAAAVTLGRTIVVRPDTRMTPTLLAHELAHVRQWEQVPFFPVRYVLATLRHGYRDNPYEVEARAIAASASSNPTGESS
jgi:hypothetical protein